MTSALARISPVSVPSRKSSASRWTAETLQGRRQVTPPASHSARSMSMICWALSSQKS